MMRRSGKFPSFFSPDEQLVFCDYLSKFESNTNDFEHTEDLSLLITNIATFVDTKNIVSVEQCLETYCTLLKQLMHAIRQMEEFSESDSSSLAELILNKLAYTEEAIYKAQAEKSFIASLANRNKLKSPIGMLLLHTIPKLNDKIQLNLFTVCLESLRPNVNTILPTWVYSSGLYLLCDLVPPKLTYILIDNLIELIDFSVYSEHTYPLLAHLMFKHRQCDVISFLTSLINNQNALGHNRVKQKNITSLFFQFFELFDITKQKNIYTKLILPMQNNHSEFIRMSFVEFIERIRFISAETKCALYKPLYSDDSEDVKRFASNALHDIGENEFIEKNTPKKASITGHRFIVASPNKSSNTNTNHSKNNWNKALQDDKQREFDIYVKSIPPNQFINKIIAGLTHSNDAIRKHCFEILSKRYLSQHHNEHDCQKWLNIIIQAYIKCPVYFNERETSTKLFWLAKRGPNYSSLILKAIAKIVSRPKPEMNCVEWFRLMNSIIIETEDEVEFDAIKAILFKLIEYDNYDEYLKCEALSVLYSLENHDSNYYQDVFPFLLAQAFKRSKQTQFTATQLCEQQINYLDEKGSIENVHKNTFDKLMNANYNNCSASLQETVITLSVFIIAQYGNDERSFIALTILKKVLNTSSSDNLSLFTHDLFVKYGIHKLESINEFYTTLVQFQAEHDTSSNKQTHHIQKQAPISLDIQIQKYIANKQFTEATILINSEFPPRSSLYLGEIALQKKQLARAIEYFKHYYIEYPLSIISLIYIYQCYFDLGHVQQADLYRNKIIEMSPLLSEQLIGHNIIREVTHVKPYKLTLPLIHEEIDIFIRQSLQTIRSNPLD